MSILSGISDFFGLDIGASGIRLVQLKAGSARKSLLKYSFVPIDPKTSQSDSKEDQQKLASIIADLVSKSQLSTKNVAVGIPSNKVFISVVDIDKMPNEQLEKSIKYQVDSLIPTAIDESKIDWSVIGDSPVDKTKIEILLSSVPNSYTEKMLDLLEGIGLNVIAFEPNPVALARSLVVPGSNNVQLLLDIGSRSTDLVIVMNDTPRLIRSIPTGSDAIVRAASQNLNVDYKQAFQLVFKFGIAKDKLDGQVYQALLGSVDILVSEIEKSINFFSNRYNGFKINKIIVTGVASTLPEFPLYLANRFGLTVEIGNSWINTNYDPSRQNELLSISNHFGVAVGLAERINA